MSDSNDSSDKKTRDSADQPSGDATGKSESTAASAGEPAEKTASTAAAKAKQKAAPTARVLDELSRGTGSKAKPGAGSKPRRKTGGAAQFMTLLVILLPLLAAIAFLGWQQWTLRQSLTSLSQQNQQLQATLAGQSTALSEQNTALSEQDAALSEQSSVIEQLQQRPESSGPAVDDNDAEAIAELSQTLDQTNRAISQTNQTLNSEINRLQQQLADLQNQRAGDPAEPDFAWKVFEAEYLVNQAVQKLQLESDLTTAISLLEQADAALLASAHSEAFAVRQIIAEDLTRLRNVETVDRDGIYLRLANLASSVADVDLLQSMREEFEMRQAQDSRQMTPTNSDNGVVNSTLGFLSEVFVWRRWDERPEAILAPGQETVIKLNLRLFIKQAQLALITRDQQQYSQSLADTRNWLQRYAVTDSATGRNLNAEIGELLNIDIAPPLPSLSASLTRIRQLADSER